jgi:flagellar hook assembly protein FlgD
VGGTPGKINSVMTISAVSNSTISISPNPFSPDGDGLEDYCIIHYNLPMPASMLNVRIYDIKGRCIRMLANGEFAGAKGEIIWDGLDENRQRARIGVYIVYLEATDRSSGRVERAKTVAVAAAKL